MFFVYNFKLIFDSIDFRSKKAWEQMNLQCIISFLFLFLSIPLFAAGADIKQRTSKHAQKKETKNMFQNQVQILN